LLCDQTEERSRQRIPFKIVNGWRQFGLLGCRAGWDDGINGEHDVVRWSSAILDYSRASRSTSGQTKVTFRSKLYVWLIGLPGLGDPAGLMLSLRFVAREAHRVIAPCVIRGQFGRAPNS
jgi:hypothetical protein